MRSEINFQRYNNYIRYIDLQNLQIHKNKETFLILVNLNFFKISQEQDINKFCNESNKAKLSKRKIIKEHIIRRINSIS